MTTKQSGGWQAPNTLTKEVFEKNPWPFVEKQFANNPRVIRWLNTTFSVAVTTAQTAGKYLTALANLGLLKKTYDKDSKGAMYEAVVPANITKVSVYVKLKKDLGILCKNTAAKNDFMPKHVSELSGYSSSTIYKVFAGTADLFTIMHVLDVFDVNVRAEMILALGGWVTVPALSDVLMATHEKEIEMMNGQADNLQIDIKRLTGCCSNLDSTVDELNTENRRLLAENTDLKNSLKKPLVTTTDRMLKNQSAAIKDSIMDVFAQVDVFAKNKYKGILEVVRSMVLNSFK